MNKRCYNKNAWYHSNISNKSKIIYRNIHDNDTVKKTILQGFPHINLNVV